MSFSFVKYVICACGICLHYLVFSDVSVDFVRMTLTTIYMILYAY